MQKEKSQGSQSFGSAPEDEHLCMEDLLSQSSRPLISGALAEGIVSEVRSDGLWVELAGSKFPGWVEGSNFGLMVGSTATFRVAFTDREGIPRLLYDLKNLQPNAGNQNAYNLIKQWHDAGEITMCTVTEQQSGNQGFICDLLGYRAVLPLNMLAPWTKTSRLIGQRIPVVISELVIRQGKPPYILVNNLAAWQRLASQFIATELKPKETIVAVEVVGFTLAGGKAKVQICDLKLGEVPIPIMGLLQAPRGCRMPSGKLKIGDRVRARIAGVDAVSCEFSATQELPVEMLAEEKKAAVFATLKVGETWVGYVSWVTPEFALVVLTCGFQAMLKTRYTGKGFLRGREFCDCLYWGDMLTVRIHAVDPATMTVQLSYPTPKTPAQQVE